MRAFILGSSGELLDHDLSLLKGETVFASNAMAIRYPEIISHYVCLDMVMGLLPEVRSLVPDTCKKYYSRLVWNTIDHEDNVNVFDTFDDEQIGFALSHTKVYSGKTVSYATLQIAASLGYDEIYLLGIDLGLPANGIMYIPEQQRMFDILSAKNLRSPISDKRGGALTTVDLLGFITKNYIFAKSELDKKGIKVFNLSRGGNLNCFPRAELKEVLNKELIK